MTENPDHQDPVAPRADAAGGPPLPDPDPGAWSATPPYGTPSYGAPSYDPAHYGTPQYGQQAYPDQPYASQPVPPAQPFGQQPYAAPGYPTQGYGTGYSVPGFAGVADPWAPYGRDPATGTPLSDKSKTSAGLLQLLLGGFGAGRFYLGHNGIAIAQLATLFVGWFLMVTFLFGIFILLGLGVWVLVDAIMMFSGGVRDSRGLILRP